MPCKKFWSTEIKNKLADSPKSASQLQLFSDTLICCYSFVTIGNTQGPGSIQRFRNSTEYHNSV